MPPARFWQFDDVAAANAGLADPLAGRWLGNAALDLGQPVADGPRGARPVRLDRR